MTTMLADDMQLGLFEPEDLLPPPPPLLYPDNLLPEQEQAPNLHALLDLFDGWYGERQEQPATAWRMCRAWRPTPAGPRYELGVDDCAPVILSVDLRCDHGRGERCECVGDLIYRHGCASCGHLDPARDCENLAVEDAMDHRWQGWRDLPAAPRWEFDGTPKAKPNALEKWEAACVRAGYSLEWLRAGGPIRTARSGWGTRHVPGRTPHGGYDLSRPSEQRAS